MARLTVSQWRQAQADYEVKGLSLGDIARQLRVATSTVSRRAKTENWVQGKMQGLVAKKVALIKDLAEVNATVQDLPQAHQWTIETVAKARLRADGVLAELDIALIQKGMELLRNVSTPEEYELLARSRKHLAPQQTKETTTVNVNQQTAMIKPLTPAEALREIARRRSGEE